MPFSLGGFELLAILAVFLPTIVVVAVRGYSTARWPIAATLCMVAAAVITPADLLTMMMLSIAFFALLIVGSRMGEAKGRA